MSCYLRIKKDGVVLCRVSRNDEMYQALDGMAKYEEWTECRKEDLIRGCDILEEDIQNY